LRAGKLVDKWKKNIWYAEIVLFCLVAIWGINTPVMKIGIEASSPLVFNSLRLVLAAVLSFLAMLLTKSYKKMPLKDVIKVANISCFGFFLNQVFFVYGLPETTAGNASLVLALLPVSVALINRVLKIDAISRRVAIGIVISLIGVIIIILGAEKEISMAGPHILGAISILIAQFAYGYYTVFFNKLVEEYSIYQIMACVTSICAFLFCLISLPELIRTDGLKLSATVWYCLIYSSLFAVSVGNSVWFWVVGILGSTRASMFHNLSPIFSIAFAWTTLGETFGLLQGVGAVVIFLGLYFTRNQRACELIRCPAPIKTEA
jgi:O-acetylserine/cysteine efflux transporter